MDKLTAVRTAIYFRNMGRPPLSVKATIVLLPYGFAERIEAIAGKQRRSKFIREAVRKELERAERASKRAKTRKRR